MKIRLHSQTEGQGFPLLLLHGNGEDSTYFENQISFFARKYQVFAVDTRGHGESPRGTEPFTLERFAEDLLNFMQEKQIEKAHILGFSDGGNIALLFALRYPEKVGKLILNGANLFPSGMKLKVLLQVWLEYLSALICKNKRQMEMMQLMTRQPNIAPASLADVKCPVLVIAGTKDMIRESHTRCIAAHLPQSKLLFLPGDHFVAAGNAPAFNRAVLEFLEEE